MSKLQEELKSYARVDRGLIKLHEGFHEIIFRAAGNDFLLYLISRLIVLSGAVRYFSYTHPDQRRRTLKEHDHIIKSFESGNKKEFVELCRNHVLPGPEAYISLFHPHESIDIEKHPVSSEFPFVMLPIENQEGVQGYKNR
jgi:DNA-binding GntR family transcriptional regulator